MASAILRSLPGDDTGHILTGPFIGHPVTYQLPGPVTSPGTRYLVPGTRRPVTRYPVKEVTYQLPGPVTSPGTRCLVPVTGYQSQGTGHRATLTGRVTGHAMTGDVTGHWSRRSLPKVKVGKVRLAVTFPHTTSTTCHQKIPCIVPYPVTTPVIF